MGRARTAAPSSPKTPKRAAKYFSLRSTNAKVADIHPDAIQEFKKYDSDVDGGSISVLDYSINQISLKFRNEAVEKAYLHQNQKNLYNFEGFELCFSFCWIWALTEVLYNYFFESRLRPLYIWVTILCFLSAHVVPHFVKGSRVNISFKHGTLNFLYFCFICGCMVIIVNGVDAFENDIGFGLVIGGFIGNCTLMGHIFSIDFRLFACCISLLGGTSMYIFANNAGKWLPEQSRICFAYTFFLILCSRIIILQGRNTFLQLQKANDLKHKTSFISQIAHDIGTPLASISLALQCLKTAKSLKEKKLFTGTIKTSVEVLLMLRDEALNIAKIQAGYKPEPNKTRFSPKEIFSKAMEIIPTLSGEGNIEFECFCGPTIPAECETDKGWLCSMMFNFLSNAKKYCKDGIVTASIYMWQSSLRFEVEDQGPGVPDEKKIALFKPFTQLENKRNGTGLGLFGVASKTKILQGDFGMHDNPFVRGSVFWFSIPLVTTGEDISTCSTTGSRSSDLHLVFLGKWKKKSTKKITSNLVPNLFLDFLKEDVSELLIDEEAPPQQLSNRVLCWRDNFSLVENEDAILSRLRQKYCTSSSKVFLVHIGSTEELAIAQAKAIFEKCKTMVSTFFLKPFASESDVFNALRSRCSLPSTPFIARKLNATSLSSSFLSSTEEHSEKKQSRAFGKNGRILVLDDSITTCNLLTKILQNENFVVDCVGNGQDGLETLTSSNYEDFSCCFIDLNLPVMDGVECIERFRKWESNQLKLGRRTKQLRIFAFTAHNSAERKKEALTAGADFFLTKHFDFEKISQFILDYTQKNALMECWENPLEAPGHTVKPTPCSRCIIVIDDTPSVVKMVSRLLMKKGFEIKTGTNGEEGLHLLKEESLRYFKCALIDLSMPIMDGIECIGRFRSWENEQIAQGNLERRSTLFAFTAHGDDTKKKIALEVGAQAILGKTPFQLKELEKLMEKFCFYDSI